MSTWLDVGLATSLQRQGLPRFTPVDDWLRDHPERVLRAHREAVEAGAEHVLAGSFRLLPHLRSDGDGLAARAVAIATEATGDPGKVWLSIGPASSVEASWQAQPAAVRSSWMDGLSKLARHGEGLAGVVLETFTDAGELLAAVAAVRLVHTGPLVACTSPFAGARLPGGAPVREVAERVLALDAAAIIGFNCGGGPAAIAEAVDACAGLGPLWAKPNHGPDLVPTLTRLATRCAWVGGCCGVAPADLAAARVATA